MPCTVASQGYSTWVLSPQCSAETTLLLVKHAGINKKLTKENEQLVNMLELEICIDQLVATQLVFEISLQRLGKASVIWQREITIRRSP